MAWMPSEPGERPTLGWLALDWIEANLIVPDGPAAGAPLTFTREQAQFILKLYEVDPLFEGPPIVGRRVLVLEDTSTTGGSPMEAVQACREAGATVVAVAVIADRASGAQERIEAAGVPYRSAYGLADLGLA